jgi:hypothetical protein
MEGNMYEFINAKPQSRPFRENGVLHSFQAYEVWKDGKYIGWIEIVKGEGQRPSLCTMYGLRAVESEVMPEIKNLL